MSNLEKVARVLARHIRYTPDLTLAPQQLVIVKGRHMIEMDRVNGDHTTLPQTRQGADY
jgi:hypothetical protein